MPRPSRLPATLITRNLRPIEQKDGPRLWNAKRRIKTTKGLSKKSFWKFNASTVDEWFRGNNLSWHIPPSAKTLPQVNSDLEHGPEEDSGQENRSVARRRNLGESIQETDPPKIRLEVQDNHPQKFKLETRGNNPQQVKLEVQENSPEGSTQEGDLREIKLEADENNLAESYPRKGKTSQERDAPQETGREAYLKFSPGERAAIAKTLNENGKLEWWKLDEETLNKFMDRHPQLREVSNDVRSFIYANGHMLDESALLRLVRNPARYFSASVNVPLALRQQIYFPDVKDAVVLMRTPHLGPRYAAFDVPLHFSKLHLKAYLKDAYNVDVLHVRSVVVQQKVQRKDPPNRYTQGELYRPTSKKKMTVLLAKPFVYPEEITDLGPWDHETYWTAAKALAERARYADVDNYTRTDPNLDHRRSIAQQAKDLLQGKTKWAPTWYSFEPDVRAMKGSRQSSQVPRS
ncbi:uncharacterized protein Z518_03006 [Rhinocladiella mackenziei CBS 650.93]|uniref:Large ribosomal subunit protein uL23m n=1 Tax=Rhinocladiella mackenziei CBS 650.93 TaxID=1442369 RepID=A0A0D2JG86_9EURO|nr:uncharacterized protein Z518_03006 [Rhinocladiella mackenziei CBS 650.93]KIX08350.1 hypothetical protein Z518_03006 [Rhinocladiella mackenziei CBS 650.93]